MSQEFVLIVGVLIKLDKEEYARVSTRNQNLYLQILFKNENVMDEEKGSIKSGHMNLKLNPEIAELKELVDNCDDENFYHIIWVSKNGTVNIYASTQSNPISTFENENGKKLQFWKGVYTKGDNYFGPEASNDPKYLQELMDMLLKNWRNKAYGHIDD